MPCIFPIQRGGSWCAAWRLGFPLLARVVGGSAGGGSQLTAEGADLLHCYQQMEKEVLATAKESFERCMARYLQLQPAEPEEK